MKSIENNKTPAIFVLGDLMLDHYIMGESTRISPEAPVPVVTVKNETYTLGGALNVVNNLVSLGAKVFAGGVVGNDKAGKHILNELKTLSVNTEAVCIEEDRITTEKNRIMASNQQIMRYDKERNQDPSNKSKSSIINFVKEKVNLFDVILLSDYNKGVLGEDICKEIIDIANKNGKKVLVDPKGNNYKKYKNAYLITPNKKESTEITGIDLVNDETLFEVGKKLKKDLNLQMVIMTLGNHGMALCDDKLHLYPTVAREVYDVTGAGDTVLAALGYGLSTGMEIGEACKFANSAAAVVVGKVGCATANHFEISAFFNANGIDVLTGKSVSKKEIQTIVTELKTQNKKIVFTNGCFDVLHAGHVSYLQKAKALGDILIVGLNSDESVQQLKGKGRPVNNEEDRSLVLAGLASIDFIVIFNEETPYELIKAIEPDILVKGADYKDKEVVGSDIAKKVVLIEFIEGKSTSKILSKIDKL